MTTDLVTIAIPVYERTDFFEEALNSALNQTVRCPILVMDNGSSHDKFRQICEQYPSKVEYHKNPSNIGMYPNWNLCFRNSKTPFVMLLGDDDILSPNYIERFIEIKNRHKGIKVYYSDYQFLLWPQNELKDNHYKNVWGLNDMLSVKQKAIVTRLGFPSVSCVINRDLLIKSPFEEAVHGSNDWFTIYHFDNNTVVYGDNNPLVRYRKHQKANTKDSTVQNCLNLTQLLTLCDLTIQLNANLIRRIIWFGRLHFFIKEHEEFSSSFLNTESCYRSVYNSMQSNHKLLYQFSLPIYNIILFFLHGRSGKIQHK